MRSTDHEFLRREVGRYDRNVVSNYLKYQTRNPLVQFFIRRFVANVIGRIREIHPARILDVGCGEGALAAELDKLGFKVAYFGVDAKLEAVTIARRLYPERVFLQADLFDLESRRFEADLVVCLEVLEHLREPERAIVKLASLTANAAILSVPWEPYFRVGSFLRGKYLVTWGNHPEHVQQFHPGSFQRLAEIPFSEVRLETFFPWLLATCRH